MMRCLPAFAGAGLWALAVSPATAQSSPNFSYGQVPTAGQWNAAFASKQDRLTFTPLNQAGGTMTGKLYTMPATVNGAGFSILPGLAPTSPVNGDLWITPSGLYARINGSTIALAGNASLGTMSTQNANNVAITGGTINGTSIGAAVPATGAFTTLSATSITVAPGSAVAPTAILVQPSTNATSRRAAIAIDAWTFAQDLTVSGTKDFGLYSSGYGGYVLSFDATGNATFATSPRAPTAAANDNSTKAATTAYVDRAVAGTGQSSGSIVNSARAQTAAVSTISTQTPISDTAPTTSNTSAVSGLSASITPKASTNKLRIRAVIQATLGGTAPIVASIFQGSNTTAIATNFVTATGSGYGVQIVVTYEVVAGSTAATSFYVGVGTSNGGTVTINGSGGSRLFGGTTYSSIEVTEVLP